jgi:hypothetical protein
MYHVTHFLVYDSISAVAGVHFSQYQEMKPKVVVFKIACNDMYFQKEKERGRKRLIFFFIIYSFPDLVSS